MSAETFLIPHSKAELSSYPALVQCETVQTIPVSEPHLLSLPTFHEPRVHPPDRAHSNAADSNNWHPLPHKYHEKQYILHCHIPYW